MAQCLISYLGKRREGDVWIDINIIIPTTKHSYKYQNIIQIYGRYFFIPDLRFPDGEKVRFLDRV